MINSSEIHRRKEALQAAERALLGAVILDAACLDDIPAVRSEDFFGRPEGLVWGAALDLHRAGQAVDYQTLDVELTKRGQIQEIGGVAWISSLTDCCPNIAGAKTYASQVLDASRSRQLRAALVGALRSLDGGEPAADVASALSAALTAGTFADCAVYDMRAVLSDTMDLVERCQVGTGQVATGIPELDKDGLSPMPGEYVVVGARPNVGKTLLGMHISRQMALRGDGVLIASLEMTRALLGVRHLSNHTGVPGEALLSYGGLSEDQYRRIGEAVQALADVPIWTYLDRDLSRLLAVARRTHATKGIRALMVDYLGILSIPDEDRRDLELARASSDLQALAHETGMVVYAFSQLNRQSESREDRRPRLSDLRESGAIEQDADRVWLLHRPNIGQADDSVLQVCQAKNRNGPGGQVINLDYRGGRIADGQRKEWIE